MQIFVALALALALGTSANATATDKDRFAARKMFGPVLVQLRASGVPVLLPSAVPALYIGHAYAIVDRADKNGYSVEVAFAKPCGYANYCHIGHVEGARSNGSRPRGIAVAIPLGVTAHYVEGVCKSSCSESTLTFDYHGVRYLIGDKAGSRKTLIGLASAMVPALRLSRTGGS